eukprot:sb/3474609/
MNLSSPLTTLCKRRHLLDGVFSAKNAQNGNECWSGPHARRSYRKYGPTNTCRNGNGARIFALCIHIAVFPCLQLSKISNKKFHLLKKTLGRNLPPYGCELTSAFSGALENRILKGYILFVLIRSSCYDLRDVTRF